MTDYCPKCRDMVEVRGGMFDRHCKDCGEPLMVPAPYEPEEPEPWEFDGEIF